MPNLTFNYGHYDFWEKNPPLGYYGNQKVTFDGPSKLILINAGETTIDVKEDIYSNWKEWVSTRSNSTWPKAISVLGGDPITSSTFIGDTYFLENGWRIQPWDAGANGSNGYLLDIVGNVYTREPGENPVNPTTNVSVILTRSNITETAIVGGETTTGRLYDIWRILGLDSGAPQTIQDTSITVGDITLTIAQTNAETTTVTRTS
jgi:hypothetical protein